MPCFAVDGYPRPVTTPTRATRTRRAAAAAPPDAAATDGSEAAAPHPGTDPDGGSGDVHELLKEAVDEAARLLDADGAMVYLIDPATGHLRFAHDAGIREPAHSELGPQHRPPGRRRDVRAGGRGAGRGDDQ